METGRSAEVDRALEGLGAVPSNLVGLVERYAGRARLTASDADSLLAGLAQLDQVVISESGELGARLATHNQPDQVEAERDQVSLAEHADSALSAVRQGEEQNLAGAGVMETDQVQQSTAPAFLQSSTSDTRDGPLTRRMDARDVRVVPGARKSAFSSGLLGADDLPEFPAVRPPGSGKDADEQPSVVPAAASSTFSEQTDSFEILVDEEILEIEPDDAVFDDDSPDES